MTSGSDPQLMGHGPILQRVVVGDVSPVGEVGPQQRALQVELVARVFGPVQQAVRVERVVYY
jgi:hypothetical protein